jgi:YggT family protein
MLLQALIFLITTLAGLFALALLLRFMLQLLRAPTRNELSAFLVALTGFVVRPARRIVPGWFGMDWATLVLAWLTEFLQTGIVLMLKGYAFGPNVGLALIALAMMAGVELVRLALYVVMVAVLLQAILSWIHPDSPLAPLLTSVTRPFLRPFRKLIPLVGNVDLSPLAVLLVCQLLLTVPLEWGEAAAGRLL